MTKLGILLGEKPIDLVFSLAPKKERKKEKALGASFLFFF
jgi:hypothetical protein